jgi:hypothetical protein
MNTEFCIIGIDKTIFKTHGVEYWRSDNGVVYRDDVLVTVPDDAHLVCLVCGQTRYLYVNMNAKPNGYLVEAHESELAKLFAEEKIMNYIVLNKTVGLPKSFTVVAEPIFVGKLYSVYFKFVYVEQKLWQ